MKLQTNVHHDINSIMPLFFADLDLDLLSGYVENSRIYVYATLLLFISQRLKDFFEDISHMHTS